MLEFKMMQRIGLQTNTSPLNATGMPLGSLAPFPLLCMQSVGDNHSKPLDLGFIGLCSCHEPG